VLNALAPIVVTLLGIVKAVNPVQPLKAVAPIVVTLLGIVKAVNPVRPLKAESPIVIILVAGVVVDVIVSVVVVADKVLNILFGITQLVVVPWIVRVVLRPAKALDPTLKLAGVDVYPRLIVARAEQVLNALAPIVVTLPGMITLIKPVDPLNAFLPIVVKFVASVTLVLVVDKPENNPIALELSGII